MNVDIILKKYKFLASDNTTTTKKLQLTMQLEKINVNVNIPDFEVGIMVLAKLQFCCPDDYVEIPNAICILDQECLHQKQFSVWTSLFRF